MAIGLTPPHEPPRPPRVATGHVDDDPQFSIQVQLQLSGGRTELIDVHLRKVTINVGEVETGAYVAVEVNGSHPADLVFRRRIHEAGFSIRSQIPEGVEVRSPERTFFLERSRSFDENAQNLFDRASDFLLRLRERSLHQAPNEPAFLPRLKVASGPQSAIEQGVDLVIDLCETAYGTRAQECPQRREWIAHLYRNLDIFFTTPHQVDARVLSEVIALINRTCLGVDDNPELQKKLASELRALLQRQGKKVGD